MPSIAVVGGSRGIGLEFVRQLSTNIDNIVYVVVWNKARSTELAALAQCANNVHVFEGDVVNAAGMKAAATRISEISGGSLDVLIHNAARTEASNLFKSFVNYDSDEQLDEEFITAFKVNVLGVTHSVNAFLPLLRKGANKKIIVIGTSGGEREFVLKFQVNTMAAYGTTKAATHMVMAKYAVELKPEGFIVAAFCPGLVATHTSEEDREMIEKSIEKFPGATFMTVDAAVQRLLDEIYKVGPAESGKFFSKFAYPGNE